jgi:hypothetical protein
MSFDLKVSLQQRAEPSAQQKKLNRLIDKIEQQKISLSMWQNAQAEIQQHTRQKLLPVYSELHEILFQQLEQLWNMLHSHEFSKANLQQLDEKIAQLAQLLKRSKMLKDEQLKLVSRLILFISNILSNRLKRIKKYSQLSSNLMKTLIKI